MSNSYNTIRLFTVVHNDDNDSNEYEVLKVTNR